jgi:hypothetical protein
VVGTSSATDDDWRCHRASYEARTPDICIVGANLKEDVYLRLTRPLANSRISFRRPASSLDCWLAEVKARQWSTRFARALPAGVYPEEEHIRGAACKCIRHKFTTGKLCDQ